MEEIPWAVRAFSFLALCLCFMILLITGKSGGDTATVNLPKHAYASALSSFTAGKWNEVRGEGRTQCGNERPFDFYVRPGDPSKALLTPTLGPNPSASEPVTLIPTASWGG